MDISVSNQSFVAQRVFCIGRNYAAHAKELNSEIPTVPVVFMKPSTCLVSAATAIRHPAHGSELHHEAELVVLIGRSGRVKEDAEASAFIAGLALGLDLTMRDVQRALKAKGLPWEKAKAFEQSAPIGAFVPYDGAQALDAIEFTCEVNGVLRQRGHTERMLFPIPRILRELSAIWTLREGDLIYTGTPEGVGPLRPGDVVELAGDLFETSRWTIEVP